MSQLQSVMPKPLAAGESRSFWVIFALGYAVFLGIAVVGQLLGWHWRDWLPGAEGVKSIFGGVKAAVYTFMSHLT
jgi:light-harvesting complex 1 beta chain